MTLLYEIDTVRNPKLIGLSPFFGSEWVRVSSLGLKKCLDTVFFVQGLEVVIPSDMFLVYEDIWHKPLVRQL